jgi:hypothetical protein
MVHTDKLTNRRNPGKSYPGTSSRVGRFVRGRSSRVDKEGNSNVLVINVLGGIGRVRSHFHTNADGAKRPYEISISEENPVGEPAEEPYEDDPEEPYGEPYGDEPMYEESL